MKDSKIGKIIEDDERKKEKAIFKAKLKHGEHWGGVTILNPGQQIKVINGKIYVR